ncbi:MAG: family efflux transporter subunit [Candidatus Peribacteria bacterium]|nr:family efflux transporter subunit [Candidatus Peribacteria bacterium]
MFVRLKHFLQAIVLKSYIFGLITSLVIGGGYVGFAKSSTKTQAAGESFSAVERQTITSSVKATGKVTFANEQQLRFNQKGKVMKVLFKEGDAVKKGQLIAELDTSTIQADIRQAQLSVSASALQLQQLQADKENQILNSQNAVSDAERQFIDAQNSLDVAKKKLPTDITGAERDMTEKQAALNKANAELDQARITAVQDLASTANDSMTSGENLLDTLYGVLVNDLSARRTSGSKEIVIYYRNYNDAVQKDATERSYYEAANTIESMRNTYGSTLASVRDATALAEALAKANAVATAVHTLADKTYTLLQGATDDPTIFTVSDINKLKQQTATARSTAAELMKSTETARTSLVGNGKNLTSLIIQQKQDAVSTAQHSLLSAQENLAILQTQTPGDLQKQAAAVAKIQDDFRAKQAALNATGKTSDVNAKLKQNDIAQKATSLQKTLKTIDDYRLTAPFDGIIRRMDYKVGDNLLDTGETKYVIMENPDFLIVTVPLDQVDVVRVRKNMTASIVFDALPGQTFTGTINDINTTAAESSGVVSYDVAITMPAPKDLTILSGMTTTVTIETTHKDNILVVPNLALKTQGGTTTVRKATGETVPVQTGVTNGKVTEIVSGLREGDSIVSANISVSTSSQGANSNAAQQLLRSTGGFGGGAGVAGAGGNFRSTTRGN